MKLTCESFVRDVLPCVRALLAKRMIESYRFSQTVTARRLGLSQPAVSQYRKNLRGYKIRSVTGDSTVSGIVDELAKKLAERRVSEEEFSGEMCRICKAVSPDSSCAAAKTI